MEDNNESTPPPFFDQLKDYAETRFKLAKYEAIENGTSIVAGIVSDIAVIFGILLAVIFASFTLAFFLGDVMHSTWAGFGCVSLIYIIFAVVLKYKKQILEKPIINALIKKLIK